MIFASQTPGTFWNTHGPRYLDQLRLAGVDCVVIDYNSTPARRALILSEARKREMAVGQWYTTTSGKHLPVHNHTGGGGGCVARRHDADYCPWAETWWAYVLETVGKLYKATRPDFFMLDHEVWVHPLLESTEDIIACVSCGSMATLLAEFEAQGREIAAALPVPPGEECPLWGYGNYPWRDWGTKRPDAGSSGYPPTWQAGPTPRFYYSMLATAYKGRGYKDHGFNDWRSYLTWQLDQLGTAGIAGGMPWICEKNFTNPDVAREFGRMLAQRGAKGVQYYAFNRAGPDLADVAAFTRGFEEGGKKVTAQEQTGTGMLC